MAGRVFLSALISGAALALALAASPLLAQDGGAEIAAATPAAFQPEDGDDLAEIERRRSAREAELEATRLSIGTSERRQEALRGEIGAIESDRAKLNADLIATARAQHDIEAEVQTREARLLSLGADADRIRLSLAKRRAVLAEVLGALQRIGRSPPPPLLARPEDALAAIRGSILAEAVLPGMRSEAAALAADLRQLDELTRAIAAERDALGERYAALAESRTRIDLLIRTRKAQGTQAAAALTSEREKAAALGLKARSLSDLLTSIERDRTQAARTAEAAEQARRAAAPPAASAEAAAPPETPAPADAAPIAPAIRFAEAKGLLPLPAAGTQLLAFGAADETGAQSHGVSLATGAEAQVVAPADAKVIYAGPFRSYGKVLILDAGDGYHIVLAGMDRIDAEIGQFVLAGEPVARMGATKLASLSAVGHSSAKPTLYIEFRKDGSSIDPAPWWATKSGGGASG